uniref:HEPN domain-containing protein n=1 Tax=Desulfatirhabdium butyrativorans TaxID=340467 RepID=A0A7C4MMP7_9BACT
MMNPYHIHEAVQAIVRKVHPVSIVLFGSVARDGDGNDLDLMIVVDGIQASVEETRMMVHQSLLECYRHVAVDPFVVTIDALYQASKRKHPFLRTIVREGKVVYMKDADRKWMHQAREELDMAEYLFQGKYYKGSCYHAQQALEKGIKARLFKKGWELEKTHSIARLVALCREYHIRLGLKEEEIVFMDGIYRGRYPAEEGLLPFQEPSAFDAEKAIQIAGKIIKSKSKEGSTTSNRYPSERTKGKSTHNG